MSMNRPFTREQRTTVVYGMLAFILILVILQLWLLVATMNAYLGGDERVIWAAAGASPSSDATGYDRRRHSARPVVCAIASAIWTGNDAPRPFRNGHGAGHRSH